MWSDCSRASFFVGGFSVLVFIFEFRLTYLQIGKLNACLNDFIETKVGEFKLEMPLNPLSW